MTSALLTRLAVTYNTDHMLTSPGRPRRRQDGRESCAAHRSLPLAPAVYSTELPVVAVRMSPVKLLTVLTWRGTARLMSHCCTVLQEQLHAGKGSKLSCSCPELRCRLSQHWACHQYRGR
jgi:hypothetical protein